MLNPLPDELSFINEHRLTKATIAKPKWLLNEVEENLWYCIFGNSVIYIDFSIALANGSLLTHCANSTLLDAIKQYLCALTHPSAVGTVVRAENTGKQLLRRALHVLDHFLICGSFVSVHGTEYRQLSKNDIHHFIATISASRSIKTNIYEPERRITDFVRTLKVTPGEIASAKKRVPGIFRTESCDLPEGVSEEQLKIARVWLYVNKFYIPGSRDDLFKYEVSATRLLNYLIGKKVLSNLKFDNLELDYLCFEPREQFVREFQSISVAPGSEDERAGIEYVQSYLQILSIMGHEITADHALLTYDALTALDEKEVLKHGQLKAKQRFATLPFEIANLSLRRAIEFYLEYGEDLVNYYLTLAEKNWQGEWLENVPLSLMKLGVRRFKNTQVSAKDFFAELRNGVSLYQMLQVLLGAIIVIVNTLMARRDAELRGLTSSSIVPDGPYFFLAFDLGKANLGEVRERVLRPIPPLGAEALGLLARLSEQLNSMGYQSSHTLFQRFKYGNLADSTPYGTTEGTRIWLRLCLNRFCDYIEIPTDENSCRHYIRPHQLRRNFAMIFFWQGSFGGIEVLRYFLGHQRPSETYRYVTESLKGSVLRRVKAKVAAELIKADSSATDSLAQFICERHGITLDDLHVLPETDVIDYIEDLLSSKEAEIEPEFVDGPNGEEYKILYKICAVRSLSGEFNG
ncbi:phage integrase family protein [Massilia forsythiae]|uniref:Phage integrase family protein n=1 Tax=Massilia forsythiae TaxID=2728020 RepID=A0A7Z2ZS52_9BURK|nr:hypothetical protein [Massilia forsythiae]QJD99829.1 phage integrase family protein [Massilia forsythiae]